MHEAAERQGPEVAAMYAARHAERRFKQGDYGQAAAVDVLAKPWGLPPSISTHNNYYLWGPRGHSGGVVIHAGGRREELLKVYASVEAMGATDNPWALPLETGRTIWICRGRFRTLDADWTALKHYR